MFETVELHNIHQRKLILARLQQSGLRRDRTRFKGGTRHRGTSRVHGQTVRGVNKSDVARSTRGFGTVMQCQTRWAWAFFCITSAPTRVHAKVAMATALTHAAAVALLGCLREGHVVVVIVWVLAG